MEGMIAKGCGRMDCGRKVLWKGMALAVPFAATIDLVRRDW